MRSAIGNDTEQLDRPEKVLSTVRYTENYLSDSCIFDTCKAATKTSEPTNRC